MRKTDLTIFHITHWKAGSQWIAEIFRNCAPERFVPMSIVNPHSMGGRGTLSIYVKPLKPGKVYGTVYLTREQFQNTIFSLFGSEEEKELYYFPRALRNWWNFGLRKKPFRSFVVIRDLRDTLISLYFSAKNSHKIITDQLSSLRNNLNTMDEETGLLHMLDNVLPGNAAIQLSWIDRSDALLLKYEDILGNEYAFFENLMEYCEINIAREKLRDIVYYNIFENATGRKRGDEDVNAHMRKGIAGDWKNYFTDTLKERFKSRFGDVLIRSGYERDLNW